MALRNKISKFSNSLKKSLQYNDLQGKLIFKGLMFLNTHKISRNNNPKFKKLNFVWHLIKKYVNIFKVKFLLEIKLMAMYIRC